MVVDYLSSQPDWAGYQVSTKPGSGPTTQTDLTNDESALKTLWLMICNIEDKRAAKRAKQGKRVSATAGRLMEGARVSGWKQAINQMAVAFPDRFDKYL